MALDGREASIIGEYFFKQIVLENEGAQSLNVLGTLLEGSTVKASVRFDLFSEPNGVDTKPPVAKIIFPENGAVFGSPVIETILTVEEGVRLAHVAIDDVVAHRVIGNIMFVYALLEEQGENTISVVATDAAKPGTGQASSLGVIHTVSFEDSGL